MSMLHSRQIGELQRQVKSLTERVSQLEDIMMQLMPDNYADIPTEVLEEAKGLGDITDKRTKAAKLIQDYRAANG